MISEHSNSNNLDEPAENQKQAGGRISVIEISRRLRIGRVAVYKMLEQGVLPGVRIGRRWLITRFAYEAWERTCGSNPDWTSA